MATPGPAGNPGLYGVQGMAHSAAVRFRYTSHSSNYSITTQSPADCFVFYWNTNGELWHRHLRKRFTNQQSGASAARRSSLPASTLTAACVRYAEMRPATSSMHRTYTTVRPGIFKRARRQYMRAGADLKRSHFIPLYRSYRLISYNGYFKGTKSRAAAEALNQQKLFKSAKWAVRAAAIKERSLAV